MRLRLVPRARPAFVVLFALLCVLLPTAVPAAAKPAAKVGGPSLTGSLTFTPNPATSGQTVTASGCGFATPIGTVTVTINGFGGVSPTNVTSAGPLGCYNISFTVPS